MGTNTGIGIGIGIPFKNFKSGGRQPLPPDLKASLKGVWIAYGKSNNDADRSIVKNLVDLDNPFIISNAAFKLNSGFGKYEVDFTSWIQTNGVIASSDKVQNSIIGRFLYFNTVNKKEDVPSFKVNITLGQQGKLQYNYIKEDGTSKYIVYSESGIYTIPASYFSKYTGGNAWFGFYQIEGTSIIEQIPSFEGAFVTDGVDDLITSTKNVQEMLGGSNEITVVSMIHLVQTSAASSEKAYTNQIRIGQNYLRNHVTNNGKTGIYGYTYKGNNVSVINNILGDKNDYTVENKSWNNLAKFSVIGYEDNGTINELDQVAWYWTIIANKVLTTDQINQVIAYFNLDRCVEPTVLYDVKRQGLSNDTPDSDWYLKDFSKNGFDMSLFNFAKKGNSGVGKYNFSSIDVLPNRFEGTLTSNKCHFTKKLTSTNDFCDVQVISPNEPIKFKVSGLSDERKLFFLNKNGSGSNYRFDNGEHEVSLSFSEGAGQNNSFGVTGDIGDIDVTVEFIPSRAGGLCLDGVNNFGQFVGDLGLKDYTLIMNRAYNNLINNQVPLISSNIVEDQTPFIVEHWNTGSNAISFSYGASRTTDIPLDINKKIVYQSTYSYMGYVIPKGNAISTGNGITLGKFGNGVQYSAICLWSLMLFPYSMSEFLIERQLKKHKLGTLYPDMVEFRPVIKANANYKITYYQIDSTNTWKSIKLGDYIVIGAKLAFQITFDNDASELKEVVSPQLSGIIVEKRPSNPGYNIYSYITSKSPQKINITIDEYIRYEDIVQPYPSLFTSY